MKKILLVTMLVLIIVVSSVAMVACSSKDDYKYITGKGTLVCGITLYEPMNYFDDNGDLVGFDTEFAKAVAEKLGVSAKFQVIEWKSKEIELSSKSIDCIWNGLTVTEDRKENMDFTTPYLKNSQCVVVKSENLSQYTSNASCAGKRASAEDGSAGETAAEALTSSVTAVDSQMKALMEVRSGAADFAVVDVTLASTNVGAGDYAGLAIADAVTAQPEEYAIGFRKGSSMTEKVNEAIAALIADGTLASLAEKYNVSDLLIK